MAVTQFDGSTQALVEKDGTGGHTPVFTGTLAAGTNNIGDVDVLTTVHPAALGLAGNGELIGIASATQLPTLTCKYVRIKARLTNTGYVYIGGAGVTAAAGSTTTTAGFELAAGDDTGWIPASNLNLFYRICTSVADHCTYLALV